MKKVFLIGFTLMCFASMAGCKTKPPKVAHPYVQEYMAGRLILAQKKARIKLLL